MSRDKEQHIPEQGYQENKVKTTLKSSVGFQKNAPVPCWFREEVSLSFQVLITNLPMHLKKVHL